MKDLCLKLLRRRWFSNFLIFVGVSIFTTASFAEETDYRILGVIASTKDQAGVALVKEVASQKTFAVREGTEFGKDCSIEGVMRDSVRMKIKGRTFTVRVGETSQYAQRSSAQALAGPSANFGTGGFERNGDTVHLSSTLRDHILEKELSKILMQAAAVPHYQNGQLVGFRLWDIDKESIFEKAGFKDGDIVTKIDGKPLNDLQITIRLLTSLKTTNQAQFGFIRDGIDRNLNIVVQ